MENIELQVLKIQTLKEEMNKFEADPDDYIKEYDEMLDECYGDFMGSYSASYTLSQVDPTAYRCGLLDYVDSLGISYPSEWDDELEDLISELNDMIDDEIKILEGELESLGEDIDATDEIIFYKNQIEYLEGIRNEYC